MKLTVAVGLLLGAQKPGDSPKKEQEPSDSAKKELDALQGHWKGVSGEDDVAPLAEKNVQGFELIIKGDKYIVREYGMEAGHGTIKVDPAKKVKTIDFKIVKGVGQGKDQQGVYRLEKGKLTLCYGEPGKERPKQLKPQAGSGQCCLVFQKDAS